MNPALNNLAAAIAAVLLMGASMAAVIEVPPQDLGVSAPMTAEIAALPVLA